MPVRLIVFEGQLQAWQGDIYEARSRVCDHGEVDLWSDAVAFHYQDGEDLVTTTQGSMPCENSVGVSLRCRPEQLSHHR